ncbi:MAG: glycosyltransferase family 1 protein [Candidatus Dadabacteria bacterium]|nr:MAG: glycosyltransferase family 1 protein [Candidatus Dadabacteria bacterium]
MVLVPRDGPRRRTRTRCRDRDRHGTANRPPASVADDLAAHGVRPRRPLGRLHRTTGCRHPRGRVAPLSGALAVTKSLRFLMITTFYPPYNFGGDGIGIQRLSQALARRGHHVTVLQDLDAFRVLGPRNVANDVAGDDGVECVRLSSRFPRLSILLTHQLGRPVLHASRMREIIENGAYDVINYHNVSLAGGPGVLRYGRAVKIYMAHEHWLVCPNHVLWRHGREPCPGRQCIRCVLRARRPPQLWRQTGMLDRAARHVHAFIAMSEFSRRKHREFGFVPPMEVVNYFLPPAPPLEADVPSPHDRPYFLFVGRLEKIKGLDDVIPVFRQYQDADLLIAGDGEYAPVLKRLAAGNVRVRFLGRVPLEDLSRYYRHAIALIVPSIGFETFGIILIEAFRQGTPVIARNIGPFPEIVTAARAGMLFDDPGDLKEAMRAMQSQPHLRASLADAGREAFDRHWSEEVVVPAYLRVVRRAAQASGSTRVVAALEEV